MAPDYLDCRATLAMTNSSKCSLLERIEMCLTCGCGVGEVRIEGEPAQHEHDHVHADGSRHSHAHEHEGDHTHEHPHPHEQQHSEAAAHSQEPGVSNKRMVQIEQDILAKHNAYAPQNRPA